MEIKGYLDSKALGSKTPFYILLPTNYETSTRRYPVLFLLHGLFGGFQNWVELTDIVVRHAADSQLIIVMPEGGDGWYTDSATTVGQKYERYFVDELVPHIDQTYRTIGDRTARAIAGLSMGGYGAFKFALKRPWLFAFAASFSGVFDPTQRSDDEPGFDWEALRPSILKAFGPAGSLTRKENDLWANLEGMSSEFKSSLPALYFECGTQDGFLEVNRRLSAALSAQGIPHEFNEIPGGHDWDYWNSRVPFLLQSVASRLSSE